MEIFDFNTQYKIKRELIDKFGSVREASEHLEISYSNLSRILHGKPHELKTHVEILIAVERLPNSRYKFPKEDMHTFELLNKLR